MNSKFILHFTGPISKYRLDLITESSPDILDYLICFTNKDSYEFYSEYHDKFKFLFIDDYRQENEISKKYEVFPDPLYKTEGEYFKNLHSFYKNLGFEKKLFWPFDTRRFIMPYLIENNIKNFSIINNNLIFINNPEYISKYFENIPEGCFYAPWHGADTDVYNRRNFWKTIQPKITEIELDSPNLKTADGYLRGFNFYNLEDMKLFYKIWSYAIEELSHNKYILSHNNTISHFEWVTSHIMDFFVTHKNYKIYNAFEFDSYNGSKVWKYKTRPEDKLFMESLISGWAEFSFDYSDTNSISAFIKNNKPQLHKYYSLHWPNFEITDTHIYTRL